MERTAWMGRELGRNIAVDACLDPITRKEAVMINMIHRLPDIAGVVLGPHNRNFYRELNRQGFTREGLLDWGISDE